MTKASAWARRVPNFKSWSGRQPRRNTLESSDVLSNLPAVELIDENGSQNNQ